MSIYFKAWQFLFFIRPIRSFYCGNFSVYIEFTFQPPQLLTEFPGKQPFLAFHYSPSCAQDVEARPSLFVNDPYSFHVSEDCLYLNIFTPDVRKFTVKPVLILDY